MKIRRHTSKTAPSYWPRSEYSVPALPPPVDGVALVTPLPLLVLEYDAEMPGGAWNPKHLYTEIHSSTNVD